MHYKAILTDSLKLVSLDGKVLKLLGSIDMMLTWHASVSMEIMRLDTRWLRRTVLVHQDKLISSPKTINSMLMTTRVWRLANQAIKERHYFTTMKVAAAFSKNKKSMNKMTSLNLVLRTCTVLSQAVVPRFGTMFIDQIPAKRWRLFEEYTQFLLFN